MMADPKKFNLNSVLTIAVGCVISAMISFVWNGVVQMKDSVVRLEANQVTMQKVLVDVIPRAEMELRFKTIDGQIIELKLRQQANELEVIKLRESQHR